MALVMTKAALALAKKGRQQDVEVVTYEAHKSTSNKTEKKEIQTLPNPKKDERKGIDIQRARREIIKFGITGFDAKKQEDINIAHAISLGAKPLKGQYKNYKDLKKEKQNLKKDTEAEKESFVGNKTGKNNSNQTSAGKKFNKMKSKSNSILNKYGKATIAKQPIAEKSKKISKKGKR